MRTLSFFVIFFALITCPFANASSAKCHNEHYQGTELHRAHQAIFQKTGITYAGYTISSEKKLNCTEKRSLRELVATLVATDAQERLKLREAARLIASNFMPLQQSAVTGKVPYQTFLDIAAFLYKSAGQETIEPSSPIPEYLQRAIDDQAKIFILHYCSGTRLADCSNR